MRDIVQEFKHIVDKIADRDKVMSVMGANKLPPDYMEVTDSLIQKKLKLGKEVSELYEHRLQGRVGKYETVTEFIERMTNTLDVDEDGNVIFEYYRLGISAIDEEFFYGKGVFQNSFVVIGADSGVGKTTLALQMISDLAYQDVPSQFYSFEMGDRQFFNEISPQAKNKLKKIAATRYADNLTLDFHSRDINDLAMSIQSRAEDGVKAFVIDSYMSLYVNTDSELQKMTQLSDMLGVMKKEYGILIILIAQISKSDSFNEVYDFSGGGKLKYESDVALFIRMVDGEEDTNKRHIHCEKNRIFDDKARIGIVTDYDSVTHKIVKISNFKDYKKKAIDKDGKEIRSLKFKDK